MWWERFGVAPVRPEDAKKAWHKADLVLRELTQIEKALKAAGNAKAVGWWLGPWQPATQGHQAVITLFFERRNQAEGFLSKPPVSGVKPYRPEARDDAPAPARKAAAKPKEVASKPRGLKTASGKRAPAKPQAKGKSVAAKGKRRG